MTERWYRKGGALLNEINEAKAEQDMALLWFLGQMSFVVKMNGVTVYFDPFLNDFTDEIGDPRRYGPPFVPDDGIKAEYFVCSHNHADHLCLETLLPQARKNPYTRFIVPCPLTRVLTDAGVDESRVIGARVGESVDLGNGLTLTAVAAAHDVYRTDKNGDHLCLGYVLRGGGVGVYHAGDTVVTPALVETLKKLKPVNIAILPINGGDWERAGAGMVGNMNAEDAAKLARVIDADLTVPAHYDLLGGNAVNPAFFAEAMYRLCPSKKYHIFAPGECFRYEISGGCKQKAVNMTLVEQSVGSFSLLLASDSPVPGGGSGAAASAALGASFIVMVARITSDKPEFAEYKPRLARIADKADRLRRQFLGLVDSDAAAYARFAAAAGTYREPFSSAGLRYQPYMPDAVIRAEGTESNIDMGTLARSALGCRLSLLRDCVAPPLDMLDGAAQALRLVRELSESYYPPTASDIGIAALCLETAARGAYLTIHTNLKHLKDSVFVREMSEKSREIIADIETAASEIYASVKRHVEN